MSVVAPDPVLTAWLDALERRHMANLRFAEVSRALRALSSAYVERRARLSHGVALDGGGKRAAFALSFGPLHFLTVQRILAALPVAATRIDTVVDLGCGTGAAGSAWALSLQARPRLVGIDKHQWAVAEAAWAYRVLGLRGRTFQGDIARVAWPTRRTGLVSGWTMNEVTEAARATLLRRLLSAAEHGAAVLVVEPIARAVSPWWPMWADAFTLRGGRADEWRFRVPLPDLVARLDRASGLSHDELTARSLWISSPVDV